jgi:hypothetical protein
MGHFYSSINHRNRGRLQTHEKIPRFSCVLLAVALTAQAASAETVTINNIQAKGANMKWIVTGALTPEEDTRVYSPGTVT